MSRQIVSWDSLRSTECPLPVGYRMPGPIKHSLIVPKRGFCRRNVSGWVKSSCAVKCSALPPMYHAGLEADWLSGYGRSRYIKARSQYPWIYCERVCSLASEVRAGTALRTGLAIPKYLRQSLFLSCPPLARPLPTFRSSSEVMTS